MELLHKMHISLSSVKDKLLATSFYVIDLINIKEEFVML
jgi:hypothetical protein